jgi:hypothetical protein
MVDDKVIIESGDPNSPYKSKSGPSKFSNIEIAIFVGLLCGCGLVGFYLIGLGINNMTTLPIVVKTGFIGLNHYPMSYEDVYYKSDKRNELSLSNVQTWKANTIWIGSPIEYTSFRDMRLMDGQIHEFRSDNGQFVENSIKYKRILKFYSNYESPIADASAPKQQIIIVANNNISDSKIYDIELTGNVTSPIFNIKESDDVFKIDQNRNNTYYH